jgi:predicted HD phosphohydrolase
VVRPAAPAWPAANAAAFVDALLHWLEAAGTGHGYEQVTQLDHALQSAFLAARAGAGDCAVAAALLHDLGHLLLTEQDDENGIPASDLAHEEVGARWLARMFPAQVTEPVRLHVAAKRYLCTVDPLYHSRLSDASKHSYELQGGALSPGALASLEGLSHLPAAVALRRRDDAAKVPGRVVPGLGSYRALLERLVET